MISQYIDGDHIYDLVISGANNLISFESELNRINVFPVADGDTGTNLAYTMKSIILKAQKTPRVDTTLGSISKVALQGSYGNSGMIFAQFFHGLFQAAGGREKLTWNEFTEALHYAAQHAREAVAEPVEGTILTVMKEWAMELIRIVEQDSYINAFEQAVYRASELVQQTKYSMKILKKHGVVDAGARGFLVFLQGVLAFLQTGKIKEAAIAKEILVEGKHHHQHTQIVEKNIYCSQFYIQTTVDTEKIKESIRAEGDSLSLVRDGTYLRVHIHTDRPDRVMDLLRNNGMVLSQQVENMHLQSRIMHQVVSPIAIVTDSIADVPLELLKNEQILVIPLNLICDGNAWLDKVTMRPEDFYDKWDEFQIYPTSSQPSQDVLEKAFRMLGLYFDSVIGIFVSGQMSGTFRNANQVAKTLQEEGLRIDIIDSKLNSAAEGLMVLEAIRLREKGYSHEDIVQKLIDYRERICIYVIVQDLSYMLKGGRIPKTKGLFLRVTKMKPVITIDKDGRGAILKKTMTEHQAVSAIIEKIKKDITKYGIETYALVYADDSSRLDILESKLSKIIRKPSEYIEQISPVVGLNAGRGAIALAYVKGA